MFGLFKKLSDNPMELYQNIENGIRAKASFEKLENLANNGNSIANYALSRCYANGQVINKDRNMSMKYLLKSAEGNYPLALAKLGECYYHGEGVEQNCNKGIEYYEKAIALFDEMNEKNAMENGLNYGYISDIHYELYHWYYNDGKGIEKNIDKAFYHLEKASEFNPDAYFQLALCYFNGDCTERDYQKAFEAFRTLAEFTPLTHENNYDSVEQRNELLSGFGEANYYLGLCFENGYGTSVQLNTAKYWYRKSAECGNEKAIKRLENEHR